MKYKAAVVQFSSGEDIQENLARIETCIGRAAGNQADLVIFPEHAEYLGKDYRQHASDVPGEMTRFYASCARKYGIYVHCGTLTERREDGNPYNTSILFSPDGTMAGRYRKLHMFDVELAEGPGYRESSEASPGHSDRS